MNTSYFAYIKAHPELLPRAVSIALTTPREWMEGRYPDLAPTRLLLDNYNGHGSWNIYIRDYFELLTQRKLSASLIWEELGNKILCCWEYPNENCHRRLVAEWIEEKLGIEVPEL